MQYNLRVRCKGQFSETKRIYKKKSKRDQRTIDLLREELQFSTCHKGYCVHVTILRSQDNRHTEAETSDPSYHVHFDIHLYEVSTT